MKIAFKNFLTTLRRYKMASTLNIAGLTLAFMAFYIIMAQVRYELSFNRSIDDNERVYLTRPQWDGDEYSINAPRPTSERAMAVSPDVEAGGVMKNYAVYDRLWVKHNDYDFEAFDLNAYIMSASMIDVMSMRSVAGDLHEMVKPGTVIISRTTSERIGVGVGDDIYMWTMASDGEPRPDTPMTVVGVFEDFAENTVMKDKTIFVDAADEDAADNSNWNFSIYVKLREGADAAAFASIWENLYVDYYRERNAKYGWDDEEEDLACPVKMQSLRDQYYSRTAGNGGFNSVEQGSAAATATMAGIALLIVAIAFINFVNFFFAMIPVRLRAVNVCKVFGASLSSLRWSFIFEAVGLVVCSLALAMYLMIVVQDTFLSEYVSCSLAFADNLPTIGLMLIVVVAMALVAALYPAWYITSFNASLAAKGGFAGSAAGRRMRAVLVGVQFTISMTLIIAALTFWLQYRFMVNYDIGFDRENVLVTYISSATAKKSAALRSQLSSHPDIEGVTASGGPMMGENGVWGRMYKDKQVHIYVWNVAYDFFEVMGIPLLDGDGFTPSSFERKDLMIGRRFERDMGIEVGEELWDYKVAGVYKDLRLLSVAESNGEVYTCIQCGPDDWMRYLYVRTRAGADIAGVCDFIRRTIREINPSADDPHIEFFDDGVQRMYAATKRQMVVVSLFALLAVVISLMGVFGVVLFETQHRRREIAVRRVFGASASGIIRMLNRRYAIILAICFVVAAPVAWYVADKWLSGFATRIELRWWMFVAAFAAVAVVTLGLVTLRSRRAAGENPARVLGKD